MEPDHINDQGFLMMYDEVIGAREAPLLIPDQVLTQKEAEPQREKIDELIEQLKSPDRDLILRAAIKLSDFYFIPWLNKQNFHPSDTIYAPINALYHIVVNKIYFAERGGVVTLINLMKTVTDPDLQMVIGSVVWNFGENYETLHILYESGALEPIKMFLYSNSTKLQYTGVGAIWGMMEYEVIQETAVKDGIMEKLVSLSVDALNMDAYATSERYRCFGCLQCSSTNANCRKIVFDYGADAVLKVADVENSFELLSVWFGIIILANLLVDSRFTQPLIDKGALQVIERFLNKVQTESIRAEEKEKGIVWSFVEHFFKWGDSGIPELESLSLFALAALSYLDHNRAVVAKFNMTDHLFCYQWFKTPKALEYMPIIFKNYERYNPPSLRSICEVYLKQNFTKIGFKSKKELEEFLRNNNIPNVILE